MKFITALPLMLSLVLLYGDSPPPSSQLVDLNVIALDNHGQPVRDLTREDFQVTDNKKAQTITYFRRNDAKLWQEPPLEPNESSNRTGANVPRATLILFDLLNERFGTRGTAANELVKYLESLESADYLYLYMLTLDGHIYPVHGLSAESGHEPGGPPWTKQAKAIMDQSLRAVLRVRPPDIDDAIRVILTYRALEGMALELSRIPGRKNIVWVTDGIPIELGPRRSDTGDFVDFTPELRRLSTVLDRCGIAIYPVRQVMLGSSSAMNLDGPRSPAGGGSQPGAPGGMQGPGMTGLGSIDTLDQFANMTGGRPDAGKDVGAAIQQALNDVRTNYQIGYHPPPANWDGKFHKLRVTCKRKGVKIQAKTGYYAWHEPPEQRATQAIRDAIAIPFDAAEIALRATLSPDPKQPDSARFAGRIDARDLALSHDGDQYSGRLWLALATYPADKPPEVSPIASAEIHYNAQQRDQALKDGIPFVRDVKIPANARQVRLVVFDLGSNTVGSVSVPVKPAAQSER